MAFPGHHTSRQSATDLACGKCHAFRFGRSVPVECHSPRVRQNTRLRCRRKLDETQLRFGHGMPPIPSLLPLSGEGGRRPDEGAHTSVPNSGLQRHGSRSSASLYNQRRQDVRRKRFGSTHGGSDETEAVRLPGAEFVRRWALRIVPKGYTKSRHYGGNSNHQCRRCLTACRELLPIEESPALSDDTDSESYPEPANRQHRGPQRDVSLIGIAGDVAPSWRDVMSGRFRPKWYDDR